MVSPLSRKMNSPFPFIGTCFRTGRDIREFNLSIAENHLDESLMILETKKIKSVKKIWKEREKFVSFISLI